MNYKYTYILLTYNHLPCPLHRLLTVIQECEAQPFQNENHHLSVSVLIATQVANDRTVLQSILPRGSSLNTHCGTSPKPRHRSTWGNLGYEGYARGNVIVHFQTLSISANGTELPGKKKKKTAEHLFPDARINLCQQKHY